MGIEIFGPLVRSFIQLGVNIRVTNGEIMEHSIDIRQQRRRRKNDCLQDVFLDPAAVPANPLRQYRLPSRKHTVKHFMFN